MIFEPDHRLNTQAATATAHFATSAARVFSILTDPSSWGQSKTPRVVSATPGSKIVWTFDSYERATVVISSWNSEFCQLELVLEGFTDEESKIKMQEYWAGVFAMLRTRVGSGSFVIASSPGKLNVYFAVGSFQKDSFHEVASCYQALNLREKVMVELADKFAIRFAGPMASQCESLVPTDGSNLIYRAGLLLSEENSAVTPELVSFTIDKSVPIAGGMAGGSADGAAALVALNKLFDAALDDKLAELAARLGSDVPFSLMGGTAIGLGRGQKLQKVDNQSVMHWVMTPSSIGLSTPEVYRKLDILRTEAGVDVSKIEQPKVPDELISALVAGNAQEVSKYMHNDLEIAALALRPELSLVLEAGRKAGSLRSMISGSGPTVSHLAKDRVHAEQIVSRLAVAGYPSIATYSSISGTRLEE